MFTGCCSVANTTFTFTFPGTNLDSKWDPTSATFESSLFAAMMSHVDTTGSGKSWDIRIGTSGNMYSHYVGDMYGETMPPQTYDPGQGCVGWTDGVSHGWLNILVSVSYENQFDVEVVFPLVIELLVDYVLKSLTDHTIHLLFDRDGIIEHTQMMHK